MTAMRRGFFITGTDTEIGKTRRHGRPWLHALAQTGRARLPRMKPVAAGAGLHRRPLATTTTPNACASAGNLGLTSARSR